MANPKVKSYDASSEAENYLKLREKLSREEGANFRPVHTKEGRIQWLKIRARLLVLWGFTSEQLEDRELE